MNYICSIFICRISDGKRVYLQIPFSGGSRICKKGGPEIQIPPGLKKVGSAGDSDTFFSLTFFASFTLLGRGTVRLLYQGDRGDKQQQKTKKTKSAEKMGGGGDSARPPGSTTALSHSVIVLWQKAVSADTLSHSVTVRWQKSVSADTPYGIHAVTLLRLEME